MKKLKTTSVIVEGANRTFLGVSRKYDHNSFGFAGGKCEYGESPIQCAFRELKEETGLIAHALHLVDTRDYMNLTVEPNTLDTVYCYLVNSYEGSLYTNEYLIEQGEGILKWVTADELKAGAFGDYNEAILAKLYNL